MTLIRVINSILDVSRKTTTYKLATLLGIFDYVIDHPEENSINNFHFIPIVYLAKQFFSYYYPLSFYSFSQGTPSGFALFTILDKNLKENETITNNLLIKAKNSKDKGIIWINQQFDSPDILPSHLIELIWDIRKKVINEPLRYIPNVAGSTRRFFGIFNKSISFDSDYHKHREAAKKQKAPEEEINWLDLFMYDRTSIIIDDLTYKQLAQYRFWIRDVILKRWFEFSYQTEKEKEEKNYEYGQFFNIINLAFTKEISRNSVLISKYRELYIELNALKSLFTSKEFLPEDNFDIDHFLPWSYYRVNRFWNLYALEPDKNREKSNYLPIWKSDIEEKIKEHLHKCLIFKKNSLIQNDLRYFYYVIQKKNDFSFNEIDNSIIVHDLVLAIKKDLKNLSKIIPKTYELNNAEN